MRSTVTIQVISAAARSAAATATAARGPARPLGAAEEVVILGR
jgi:hypothetical protein